MVPFDFSIAPSHWESLLNLFEQFTKLLRTGERNEFGETLPQENGACFFPVQMRFALTENGSCLLVSRKSTGISTFDSKPSWWEAHLAGQYPVDESSCQNALLEVPTEFNFRFAQKQSHDALDCAPFCRSIQIRKHLWSLWEVSKRIQRVETRDPTTWKVEHLASMLSPMHHLCHHLLCRPRYRQPSHRNGSR